MKHKMARLMVALYIIGMGMVSGCKDSGADLLEYSSQEYLDRTMAGIVGHVSGVLTGYEFIWNEDGTPAVGLPEEWFSHCGGPYGGGDAHGGAGVNRVMSAAHIASDDDYHIDFFNQLILKQKGVLPSNYEIAEMWTKHQVSDWGGGYQAMSIIDGGVLPPVSGYYEAGNIWYWCTESYIENETLGMATPGMPQTAYRLADRFTRVTGDHDPVIWGNFFAALYAQAYLETDARDALHKAGAFLPQGSWPAEIYCYCVELYQKFPEDWRTACKELEKRRRDIFDCNNILCSPDVNNGFAILAILYGENDYTKTVKIAALAGYDGDCTAATVGGLLGIIHGMDGLPQEVKDFVYADGQGVYLNDKTFDPHLGAEYPDEQSWNEICDLYLSNAKQQIKALGGKVTAKAWYIPVEAPAAPAYVVLQDPGFEDAQRTWENNGKLAQGQAHTGNVYARLEIPGMCVMQTVSGLVPNAWYRLTGYIRTGYAAQADLLAMAGGETIAAASAYNVSAGWVRRDVMFQTKNSQVEIGMQLVSGEWAGLDNVSLEQIDWQEPYIVQLEEIKLNGAVLESDAIALSDMPGDAMEWRLRSDGNEMRLCIEYQNTNRTPVDFLLFVEDETYCTLRFFPTGNGRSVAECPVKLAKGKRTMRLTSAGSDLTVYSVKVQSGESPMLLAKADT